MSGESIAETFKNTNFLPGHFILSQKRIFMKNDAQKRKIPPTYVNRIFGAC